MALVHHELCFGCGRTNLFGLLLAGGLLSYLRGKPPDETDRAGQ